MDKQISKLVDDGKSTRLIAKELGISQTTVRYWLSKMSIKTKPNRDCWKNCKGHSRAQVDWDEIQKFYDCGGTYRSIQDKFGLCFDSISSAVKAGLLTTRNISEANKIGIKSGRMKVPTIDSLTLSKRMTQLFIDRPELHPNRKVANNRSKMTYPERLVFDYLNANGVEFEHNGRVGRYWVDFLFRNHKFGIEVDGERWHDAASDQKRDAEIATYGIDIIRFKAKVVISNGPHVIDEILKQRL
jgi:very-short-patch-repair endonuclease